MVKVRALVVEDSFTVRRRICEVLGADPEIEVVGEAEDGRKAIELCCALRPSVVTMDMVLPVMSGLAAIEHIMGHCPTPILVVSSSLNRGELFDTYDALAAGALDVLEKPVGDEPEGAWERKLVGAVKLLARIRVITHPRARLSIRGRRPVLEGAGEARRCRVIAIGASTGGPGAVVEILRALPVDFPIPVLLVLHIGEPFGAALAEWLAGRTKRDVSYARAGELLSASSGRVLLAPPGRHLVLRGDRLFLTDDAERHSCRPSVDVLFESVAREVGAQAALCLLTGMGKDGAAGLLEARKAGALTIAQDESTCVVYGMPREAVRLGAAERILPLGDIGPALASLGEQEP